MPALPSSVINPVWDQFKTLVPAVNDHHPLGCHRPRVADRIIFDKLVTRLVLGGAYTKHADDRVSATTLRTRRDEWITHDVFSRLEQIVLEAFDQVIGLDQRCAGHSAAHRWMAGLRAAAQEGLRMGVPRSQRKARRDGDLEPVMPRAHRAISNLKAWIAGTHRMISPDHAQVYLDEFVFRYNRRRTPMAGFQTLLGLSTAHQPVTRAQIIADAKPFPGT